MHTFQGSLAVAAVSVLAAVVAAALGARIRRFDEGTALALFIVASVALVIAALLVLRITSPIVGYVMLCLALVTFQLVDLLRDEHARRRRVASLVPRPPAEAVPTIWVAVAVASVMMLTPYVILGEERAAALMVGICALVMAAIAWRIASAPVQLLGEDIRFERLRNRSSRSLKAGMSAALAVGSIFAFISFVNSGLSAVLPLQRSLLTVSFVIFAGLGAWATLYSYLLGRLLGSAS